MLYLSLLIACPALLLAPAAPAVRLSSPTMQLREQQQMVAPVGSNQVNTPSFSGRVVPTTTKASNSKAPASTDSAILVQGGSLRTWSYQSPAVDQVEVDLSTEGRPLDADIELWHGPDNTPCKMRVYVENGEIRPFRAVIETPRGPNTVAIRNIGQLEFPFAAKARINLPSGPAARRSCPSMPHPPDPDAPSLLLSHMHDPESVSSRTT
jgi:hypothetical protein